MDLPEMDSVRFVELEGEREFLHLLPQRESFRDDMSSFVNDLESKLTALSSEFESLLTNQDLGHALRRYLGVRNRK